MISFDVHSRSRQFMFGQVTMIFPFLSIVETSSTRSKLFVGVVCLCPYNAQVRAIQERVGKTCSWYDGSQ